MLETACKQMSSGSFKNVINKVYVYKAYILKIYVCGLKNK